MKRTRNAYLAIAAILLLPMVASADVIWDWSFDNTSGQFVTDGSDYNAGTFTLVDFSVLATDTAATIGSLSGGEYATQGFVTDPPYTMAWDGSGVTGWFHSGDNTFDWWVFDDLANASSWIFFGWETGNINTVDQGSYFVGQCCSQDSFLLSVSPAESVPEPGTLALLGLGLVGIAARRRRKAQV